MLACIQPHVASALPSLEAQLQEAGSDPSRWTSQSGWLPRLQRRQAEGKLQDMNLDRGEEVVEQLKSAVSELLRQLVALDWALVCRSKVASLMTLLQAAKASGQRTSLSPVRIARPVW